MLWCSSERPVPAVGQPFCGQPPSPPRTDRVLRPSGDTTAPGRRPRARPLPRRAGALHRRTSPLVPRPRRPLPPSRQLPHPQPRRMAASVGPSVSGQVESCAPRHDRGRTHPAELVLPSQPRLLSAMPQARDNEGPRAAYRARGPSCQPYEELADKLKKYARFFWRKVKDTDGKERPMWRTRWTAPDIWSGERTHPPVLLVFNRIGERNPNRAIPNKLSAWRRRPSTYDREVAAGLPVAQPASLPRTPYRLPSEELPGEPQPRSSRSALGPAVSGSRARPRSAPRRAARGRPAARAVGCCPA